MNGFTRTSTVYKPSVSNLVSLTNDKNEPFRVMFVILSTSAKASVDKLTNITPQVHKDLNLLGDQFIFVMKHGQLV